MIHVVTLSELPSLVVQQICRHLFLAYGVGAEHSAHRPLPAGHAGLRAESVLSELGPHTSFSDDKTLFVTDEKLVTPSGPLGEAPSGGYADPERGLAIVTIDGLDLPPAGEMEENEAAWLAFSEKVARRAIHHVGFLWGLHRCVDLRCPMSAPWLGDSSLLLCDFCRERSEERIHLARS